MAVVRAVVLLLVHVAVAVVVAPVLVVVVVVGVVVVVVVVVVVLAVLCGCATLGFLCRCRGNFGALYVPRCVPDLVLVVIVVVPRIAGVGWWTREKVGGRGGGISLEALAAFNSHFMHI